MIALACLEFDTYWLQFHLRTSDSPTGRAGTRLSPNPSLSSCKLPRSACLRLLCPHRWTAPRTEVSPSLLLPAFHPAVTHARHRGRPSALPAAPSAFPARGRAVSRCRSGGGERPCARGRGAAGVSREPRAGPARSRRRLPPPRPRHVFSLTSRCRRKDAAPRGGSSHSPAPRKTRTALCRLFAAARWAFGRGAPRAGGPEGARRGGRGLLSSAPLRTGTRRLAGCGRGRPSPHRAPEPSRGARGDGGARGIEEAAAPRAGRGWAAGGAGRVAPHRDGERWGPPYIVGRGRQGSRLRTAPDAQTRLLLSPSSVRPRRRGCGAGCAPPRGVTAIRGCGAAEIPERPSESRAWPQLCRISWAHRRSVLAPCRTCWLLLAALKNRSCPRADIFCSLTRRADGFVFKTGCFDSLAVVQLFSMRRLSVFVRGKTPLFISPLQGMCIRCLGERIFVLLQSCVSHLCCLVFHRLLPLQQLGLFDVCTHGVLMLIKLVA